MIQGKRIRLRAMERADLAHFVAWLNDPEVIAGLTMVVPISQAAEESWFDSVLLRPEEERPLGIEIADGDGWRLIGNLALFGFDWRNRSAEIGIAIGDKSIWNQGYGGEAMTLMLKHGFETLNLHRIMLRVYALNPRAIRCYEKIGFVPEGRLRQAEHRQGRYYDVLLMSVLRDEWQPPTPDR